MPLTPFSHNPLSPNSLLVESAVQPNGQGLPRRNWCRSAALVSLGTCLPQWAQAQATPVNSDLLVMAPGREILGIGKPQHAFILPPAVGNFGWANQALKAGLLAAHQRDGRQFPLLLAESDDKAADLVALTNELKAQGIGWLIGPVTRNGVNALIDSGATSIPTLTLNWPDVDRTAPRNWFIFGLASEAEARQAAGLAYDEASQKIPDRRPLRACAITQPTTSARRSAGSFVEAWRNFGGDAELPLELENRGPAEIRALIDATEPDAVFVSCGLEYVKNLKGVFEKKWPLYGTSSLSNSAQPSYRSMLDLEAVKVLEMPWLSQADHPAVMTYARAPAKFNAEMQRLYALAIDAYRLSFESLLDVNRTEIDGVTGRLLINRKAGRIERLANVLVYRNGQLAAG
jgi:uncharacterized protein